MQRNDSLLLLLLLLLLLSLSAWVFPRTSPVYIKLIQTLTTHTRKKWKYIHQKHYFNCAYMYGVRLCHANFKNQSQWCTMKWNEMKRDDDHERWIKKRNEANTQFARAIINDYKSDCMYAHSIIWRNIFYKINKAAINAVNKRVTFTQNDDRTASITTTTTTAAAEEENLDEK